jgi:DNA-binding transcriptional ArsR family regulator
MTTNTDRIWRALANPQRRVILAALRDGPKSTSFLVEQFPKMTRFAVIKHIGVLRDVGLIRTKVEGRQKMNSLNAVPIRRVYEELVNDYQDLWAKKWISVKRHAESNQSGDT